MKIGIVTLPFHYNYGGILQAYALQSALKILGYESYIISRPISSLKQIIKRILYLFSENYGFVRKNISSVTLDHPFETSKLKKYDIGVLVVGSDQVWRPRMGDNRIDNVYRHFLQTGSDCKIKKISYAASLGVDYWDFTDCETKLAQRLISDFFKISVREESGVSLLHDKLGIEDVVTVLDPTMLLDQSFYLALIKRNPYKTNRSHSFVYLLDHNNQSKLNVVNSILPKLSETIFSKVESSVVKRYFKSSFGVEDWLASIYYSDFFITDSFHGCVFAILFHKTFFVMNNNNAGNTRIHTLLSLFELTDRFVDDTGCIRSLAKINWDRVDELIKVKRNESIDFLTNALEL